MNRRRFLRDTSFSFGALALTQQKILTAIFQEPWKITMLSQNLGIFTERGGTIGFLLGKDDIVVVDSQFPDQSKHLIDELKKRSTMPFSLLINTHHHGDHTAGNISFKGLVQHVLAHENSRSNQEKWAKQQKNEEKQLYPDRTYKDTWCEKIGKDKICLHYFGPAHTNGDSVVHFEDQDIIHMGDLMFNRRHPFVDRNAGASIKGWMKVLEKTVDKFGKKTKYVFGHAAEGYEVTGNAEDLRKFNEYLGKVLNFVESEIKAGKSKEEVLKTTTLPFTTEWKGDGLQRPLQAAYEELSAI